MMTAHSELTNDTVDPATARRAIVEREAVGSLRATTDRRDSSADPNSETLRRQ